MANVLLIDDDVDVVAMLKAVLEHRGHQVAEAFSAAEARTLLQAAARVPDVIVLDVMMESQTAGFELARDIHQRHPKLPMIMLSAIHQATGVPFRFEPDADWLPVAKFIDKPIKPDVLAEQVEALTGG